MTKVINMLTWRGLWKPEKHGDTPLREINLPNEDANLPRIDRVRPEPETNLPMKNFYGKDDHHE